MYIRGALEQHSYILPDRITVPFSDIWTTFSSYINVLKVLSYQILKQVGLHHLCFFWLRFLIGQSVRHYPFYDYYADVVYSCVKLCSLFIWWILYLSSLNKETLSSDAVWLYRYRDHWGTFILISVHYYYCHLQSFEYASSRKCQIRSCNRVAGR
jgi:hypothetical protein